MPGRTKLLLIMLAALGLGGLLVFAGLVPPEWLAQTASLSEPSEGPRSPDAALR